MNSPAEQVKRGARMLDKHFPGWEKKINLDELDITSPSRCILGQLGGARCYMDVYEHPQRYGLKSIVFHGFGEGRCTPIWRELIVSRRAKRELPSAEQTWTVAKRIMNRWAALMDKFAELLAR